MLRKTLQFGLVAIVLVLFSSTLVEAKNKHQKKGRGNPMLKMYDHICNKIPDMLDLSAEQEKKFRKIKKEHREELKELMEKIQKQREEFNKDLNDILSPEQQERLKDIRQKIRKGRRGDSRRGDRMGGKGKNFMPPRLMVKALKKMDLDDEKVENLKDIVGEMRDRLQQTGRGNREEMQKIIKGTVKEIKEVLSPEEFEHLKDLVNDMKSERRGHRRGDGDMRRGGEHRNRGWGNDRQSHRREGSSWRGGWDRDERNSRPVPPPPPRRESNDNEFLW